MQHHMEAHIEGLAPVLEPDFWVLTQGSLQCVPFVSPVYTLMHRIPEIKIVSSLGDLF